MNILFYIITLKVLNNDLPKQFRKEISMSASLLEPSPGWYFVQIPNKIRNINIFSSMIGVDIKPKDLISHNWVQIYLKTFPSFFFATKSYRISAKTPKSIKSDNINRTYAIIADSSFDGKTKAKKIYNNFFIIKTNDVSFLKNYPEVLSVSYLPEIELLNRWTTGFLQSGKDDIYIKDGVLNSNRIQNDRGLDGSGTIVSVLDSGVDCDHTFFKDHLNKVPYDKTNVNHRKIVRYDAVIDKSDKTMGHGTSCAAIIAGVSECGDCAINLYKGHAFNSKLHVVDFGDDSQPGTSLFFDFEKVDKTIGNAVKLNSHIASCSWGFKIDGEENDINVPKTFFNNLMFHNPSILFVVAAGNTGKNFNVMSPANLANSLSVGATTQTWSATVEDSTNRIISLKVIDNEVIKMIPILQTNVFDFVRGDPVISFINMSIVDIDDNDSGEDCESNGNKILFSSNFTVNNKIILFRSYDCYMVNFLNLIKLENPVVLIVTDKKVAMNYNFATITISGKYQNEIRKTNSDEIKVSVNITSSAEREINVARFSSCGPVKNNGLLKPDLTAPGELITTAKNDVSTDTIEALRKTDGTSVSAPAISGVAALIVQYLTDFYPKMEKRINNLTNSEIEISSHLLKAFIVQSCDYISSYSYTYTASTTKKVSDSKNMEESKKINKPQKIDTFNDKKPKIISNDVNSQQPKFKTGFGIPNLNNVIVYDDEYQNPNVDQAGIRFISTSINSSKTHLYTLKLTSSCRDFRATLVWLDPITGSDFLPTFADLDLLIQTPDNQFIYPNSENNENLEESFSNNEKIIIPNPKIGDYRIIVISNSFPIRDEIVNYSLVINGPFPQKGDELVGTEFDNIGGTNCDKLHAGNRCQISIHNLAMKSPMKLNVNPRSQHFFLLDKIKVSETKYVVINSTVDVAAEFVSRFIINTDNKAKLTIPRLFYAKQSKENEFLYIDVNDIFADESDGKLYVAVIEETFYPGTHEISWFTINNKTGEVENDKKEKNDVTPTLGIALVALSLLAITSLLICVIIILLRTLNIKCKKFSFRRKRKSSRKDHKDQLEDEIINQND